MCPGHKMKGLDFSFFFLKKQSKETVFSEQRSSCFVLTGGCVKTHLQLNQPRLEEAGQAVPCPSLHSSQVFPSLPDHQTLCYSMTPPSSPAPSFILSAKQRCVATGARLSAPRRGHHRSKSRRVCAYWKNLTNKHTCANGAKQWGKTHR